VSRMIPPMTDAQRCEAADLLAPVAQVLVMQTGVRDSGYLIHLFDRLVNLLRLGSVMPQPVLPDTRNRYSFLGDDEIDFTLKQLDAAARIYSRHVLSKASNAERTLTNTLWMMRGRQSWHRYRCQRQLEQRHADNATRRNADKAPMPSRPWLICDNDKSTEE